MSTGVTCEDIRQANDKLRSELQCQSQLEACHVGNYQNQWQKPITEYGRNDSQWQVNLNASPFVGNIDVDASDWEESRKAVDAVMELLLKELRSHAVKKLSRSSNRLIRQTGKLPRRVKSSESR